MSENRDDIDWSLTTWEGSRRAQLRHALTLTLRERMEAVEGLADVARRLQEMRAQGELKTASKLAEASDSAAASAAHEPDARYGTGSRRPLELRGCTPEPLGNYLKALGVFRLVAEQADPRVRAWWKDGVLCLFGSSPELTNPEQLAKWLIDACKFSPLIAPWQKGTGYLPIGKRDKGANALQQLLAVDKPAFQNYREVVQDFSKALGVALPKTSPQKWIETIAQAGNDANLSVARFSKDGAEAELHHLLRQNTRDDGALNWLDAAGTVAPTAQNEEAIRWFPLLASGGGEASGQYIVNLQQRLVSALSGDRNTSTAQLLCSLTGQNAVGVLEAKAMGAMYYPGLMKAPNSGQEFLPDPERRVNPWDFILLLEGTLLWATAATRRHEIQRVMASFPFYCRSSLGGSPTTGRKEIESAESSISQGELWCPLWNAPASLADLRRLFSEGRLQLNGRTCRRAIEFVRAVCQFGVERGISAFVRYSLLKRSGSGRQTTLLAVPLERRVPQRVPSLALLEEMDAYLQTVSDVVVPHAQQPERLTSARRKLEQTIFESTGAVFSPAASKNKSILLEPLLAAAAVERELAVTGGKVKYKRPQQIAERSVSPISPLSGQWLRQCEIAALADGHAIEFRLARAIAGISPWGEVARDGRTGPAVEAVRANLLPVARRGNSWQWDETSRSAVWTRGASLTDNLVAVLRRRFIDSTRGKGEGLPLWSGYGAGFEDLLAFWQEEIDEQRLADLIHALALVDAGTWAPDSIDRHQRKRDLTPDLHSSAVWFDADDDPRIAFDSLTWHGQPLLTRDELRCAFELPRVYALLKLCFVGGRLPARPVEDETVGRTGDESYPPSVAEILNLLQAGRLPEAVGLAVRKLRSKGYPAIFDPRLSDAPEITMSTADCRRLAGLLLIPIRHAGVLAALAIKPRTAYR